MPVCSLTNSYKEAMKRGPGRLKAFTYTHREGINMEDDLVEYRIASDSSGTRVIYYRNMKQAMVQKNSYLKRINDKVEGYTEEGLEKSRDVIRSYCPGNNALRNSRGDLLSL